MFEKPPKGVKVTFIVDKEDLETFKKFYRHVPKEMIVIKGEEKPEAEAKEEKSEPKKESTVEKVKRRFGRLRKK